ncbi:TetR/AcrR family transcriptional regulator [Amycolatopsis sp. cmx-4-68]|uniref:TetR/AcrR family transcriptional regulator n=1 Tax=Amycolatopsis sp. cmx-4-68 TaxID=2790938 RepID=UPI00397E6309
MPEHPNRERAVRILDSAGALLLRMGYRKVAIDDIARAVGIGKGTVYLHWRNKEVLFQALLMRESADLTEELLNRMRTDPAEILPHRMIPTSYLMTCRRPLTMALLTGNAELFGSIGDSALRHQQWSISEDFEKLMRKRGLVRTDVPNLTFALRASTLGFYLIDSFAGDLHAGLDADRRAAVLAHTIRAAFEPPGKPNPATVATTAAELTSTLDQLVSSYRKRIYMRDPTDTFGS